MLRSVLLQISVNSASCLLQTEQLANGGQRKLIDSVIEGSVCDRKFRLSPQILAEVGKTYTRCQGQCCSCESITVSWYKRLGNKI